LTETTTPTPKVFTGFLTFTAGSSGNVISVKPTSSSQIGLYKLTLTQTNTKGTASVVITALDLTVNCRVTSLPALSLTTAQRTYALGSAAKTLDFTDSTINPMTQTPACDYTWTTQTFAWSGLPAWITTTTSASGVANAVLNFA
jgi:hypothetical protein